MFKNKMMTVFACLVLSLVLMACGSQSLEDAVQEAASQAEEAATASAEITDAVVAEIEEAVEEVSEAVEDVQAPEEAPEDVAAETEEDMNASMEEMDMSYDADIYGDIDELNVDGITVNFWHQHRGGREEELLALVEDFNANNPYGIVVEATNEGAYNDIYDKMIAGLTTGDVPDLVVAYQNQAAAYQVAEGLISLDPYINHPEYGLSEEDRADFFTAFLDSDRLPQFGGESFGFPPNRSMEVLYYNQDWLERLGYDAPPQTPEEFAEMACAATDEEAGTVGYEVDTNASRFASFIFARGGDIYDYENNRFILNSTEAVEAMTFIQELFEQGCISLIAEQYGDQADFGNQKTLFTVGTSSGLPFYKEEVEQGESGIFNWSVAAVPYVGETPVQNVYGASVSIPRTTPEEQFASWLFIKFYTSADSQARWARASNYFPVRESVARDLEDYFAENPAYEAAFSLLQYGKTEAPVAGYDNVRDEIEEAYNRILQGEDVTTVLGELNDKANDILAQSAP